MRSNEALALSDMDATYFELEQAALEQSLRMEQGKKQKATNSTRRRKHGRSSPGAAPLLESDSHNSSKQPSSSMVSCVGGVEWNKFVASDIALSFLRSMLWHPCLRALLQDPKQASHRL